MPQHHPRQHTGEPLARRFGIVCGRVQQFADALDVPAGHVLDVVEDAGIELMVDTATDSSTRTRTDYDRPTDPDLRCLAMTREDFARVLAAVQTSHSSAPPTLRP